MSLTGPPRSQDRLDGRDEPGVAVGPVGPQQLQRRRVPAEAGQPDVVGEEGACSNSQARADASRPDHRCRRPPSLRPTWTAPKPSTRRCAGCSTLRMGELTIWCTRLPIARVAPQHPGQEAEVDVARQHVDGARRVVAVGEAQQQRLDVAERAVERGPVLHVEGSAQPLAEAGGEAGRPRRRRSPRSTAARRASHRGRTPAATWPTAGGGMAGSASRTMNAHSSSSTMRRCPGSRTRPLRASIITSRTGPRSRAKLNG